MAMLHTMVEKGFFKMLKRIPKTIFLNYLFGHSVSGS